jgi:tRNA nucleotidyltransferase (CCA-adding enzyme)
MTVEEEVLARVRPTKEQDERIAKVSHDLIERVRQVALYFKLEVEPFGAGSVAKNTYLKDPDIDIFMLFPVDTPQEVVSGKGLDIARSIIDGEERYAQHPYLRGTYEGFQVDLVPAYKLPDTKVLQTAVDRTPFHVEFVNRYLRPEQRDQVRLLKQFLKGIGTYGAEEATQGFSGYLVELLVMRFGSFAGALRGLLEMPPGRPIDLFSMLPEAERPAAAEVATFTDPMVLVDPVDPKRNVASPVSAQSLGVTVQAAREYLEGPSLAFFFPPGPEVLPLPRLKGLLEVRETTLVGLRFGLFHENADVVHGQLRKAVRAISRLCNREGFAVLHADHRVLADGCLILLELEVAHLPALQVHHGPRVGEGNDAEFLSKWARDERTLAGPYVEDGQWRVDILRPHASVGDLLRAELPAMNLGKQLSKELEGGVKLLGADELLARPYAEALTSFLKRTPPWRRGSDKEPGLSR